MRVAVLNQRREQFEYPFAVKKKKDQGRDATQLTYSGKWSKIMARSKDKGRLNTKQQRGRKESIKRF